jgi:hypothetical protein
MCEFSAMSFVATFRRGDFGSELGPHFIIRASVFTVISRYELPSVPPSIMTLTLNNYIKGHTPQPPSCFIITTSFQALPPVCITPMWVRVQEFPPLEELILPGLRCQLWNDRHRLLPPAKEEGHRPLSPAPTFNKLSGTDSGFM